MLYSFLSEEISADRKFGRFESCTESLLESLLEI